MDLSKIKLMICPNDIYLYDECGEYSHKGLVISALNTAKVLRENGVNAVIRPVANEQGIAEFIKSEKPTHVVLNALWADTDKLASLVGNNFGITFVDIVHSNIAFLQVEPKGILKLRELIDLETATVGNFRMAGNSRKFQSAINDSYESPCAYLPNLYFVDDTARESRRKWSGGTLRIGSFGVPRPLKNTTVGAYAALSIAHNLGTDLEYHINVGRMDGNGSKTIHAVEAILGGLPNVTLVKDVWDDWPKFRRVVRNMHLLLQPSFTETFNLVTADGVVEGIASVTSDVIEWVPDWWKASADDTEAIARTGLQLLSDVHTGRDGLNALKKHNKEGVREWIDFLLSSSFSY